MPLKVELIKFEQASTVTTNDKDKIVSEEIKCIPTDVSSDSNVDMEVSDGKTYTRNDEMILDNEYIPTYSVNQINNDEIKFEWIDIGTVVWLSGLILLLSIVVSSYLRTYSKLKLKLIGKENTLYRYLNDSKLSIYQGNVEGPMVIGFIKPKIVLPEKKAIDAEMMEYVLLHEKQHIKFFDGTLNAAVLLVALVHWFNPLVWLCYHYFKQDMEGFCDERVISEIGVDKKVNYAEVIVRFANKGYKVWPNYSLTFGEKKTKRRIRNVLNFEPWKVKTFIVAICVVAATIIGFMTQSEISKSDDKSLLSSDIQNETNIPVNNPQEEKVELVMSDQYAYEYFSALMRVHMPDVTFSYLPLQEIEDSFELEEVAPLLLSGDSSFDVYVIPFKSEFAVSLLSKGYYVDLSTYPEMNEVFDHMFPALVEGSTFNDEVFGFPLSVQTYGNLMYPRPDMEKIGWSPERLKTIDDLLDFDKEWGQSNQGKESIAIHRDFVMDQIVFRYIYNHYDYDRYHVDLDNVAFYDVLVSAKRLYESHIIRDDYSYRHNDGYVLQGVMGPYSRYSEYFPMPQVKDQNDKNRMRANWFVINPNSENIDTAVEMLRTLAEVYKLNEVNGDLYRDAEYYLNCSLDLQNIQSKVKKLPSEYLERVNKLYQQHQIFLPIPGESQLREIFTAYLNGDLEMEEAIAEAQQIIDMVSREHRKEAE
ncbi:M56 family metallopeptidase [Alkaliphilus serpentinus]|uniref:Peptidase M56 domain-containing protein n=1 Tax=Alkaliphilus serpentinus TaxID=1482731 RepID=A0A833HLJ9_9FIRM|nr:M56 family metallopeptidase [Alkaliphilus serpentinus]KAB3525926.1 hypothetical protein F8153_14435 [Alkaliphilus serpentinus]